MKRIIILTGSELRHTYFRILIASSPGIDVVHSYCEGLEKSLQSIVERDNDNVRRKQHLEARLRSENEFFAKTIKSTEDRSNPVSIPKGAINDSEMIQAIREAKPDLLVAYGCSLIKGPLLQTFQRRFLNVHLGLSPYYRGSGTNYWPLVNGEPEYVGATFMHMDAGIDTGEIIHQIRAKILPGDTPAMIGNRLIVEMTTVYRDIILRFDTLKRMPHLPPPAQEKYYKTSDFSEDSVSKLYDQFERGLITRYLAEERARCAKVPIVRNPAIEAAIQ